MNLVQELSIYISPDRNSPNYRVLDAHKKLAITLYYLKGHSVLRLPPP